VPAQYEIDKARRVVISTASGFVTGDEILAHQRKLQNDPDFDPTYSQIFDFTAVTENDINANDVRAIAATTIFAPLSRRALLVTTDEQFGLGRMFGIIREGFGEQGIRVFRDRDEALRWAMPDK
jgi:hypothetical protein